VHFNDSAPITKRDRERLANGLVAVVRAYLPNEGASVTVELWRDPSIALPWIRTVRLFRTSLLTRHHWAVPDSGWVQIEFSSELQAVIDEKNLRHAGYSQQCDECWLLIAASGGAGIRAFRTK
jgi:hypothetical protein